MNRHVATVWTICFAACAAAPLTAVHVAPEPVVLVPVDACAAALELRAQGLALIGRGDFARARVAYLESLELDPRNAGAVVQLDLIDQALRGDEVGISELNDALYSTAYDSPCNKPAVAAVSASGPPTVSVDSNQIVIMARGSKGSERTAMTRPQAAQALAAFEPAMEACYAQGLGVNPALRGMMVVELVVGADGKVSDVRTQSSTVASRDLDGCVREAVRPMRFKRRPFGAELSVLYPLQFIVTARSNPVANTDSIAHD